MPAKPSIEVSVAVLASVSERARHPYDVWTTMRERGHAQLLGTSATTVYDAVRRLERDGLVEIADRHQVGGWPQRTVYRPTVGGLDFLQTSVAGLLVEAAGDPRRFQVALSFMFALPQGVVLDRLGERIAIITQQITDEQAQMNAAEAGGVPTIFLCEQDYRLTLLRSELGWVRSLVDRLRGSDANWPAAQSAIDPAAAGQTPGPAGRSPATKPPTGRRKRSP